LLWEQGVASSNPAAPTNEIPHNGSAALPFGNAALAPNDPAAYG
jgi:hypothetical protein